MLREHDLKPKDPPLGEGAILPSAGTMYKRVEGGHLDGNARFQLKAFELPPL